MDKNENERQYSVIDQMLSMHSSLRDKYKRRALLLNLALLLVSVFLCAFVFADEKMFSWFSQPFQGSTFISFSAQEF